MTFVANELYIEEQLKKVIDNVIAERSAQDSKWGVQNHVDYDPYYAVPISTADDARLICEKAFYINAGSWSHILVEEVAEAVSSAIDGNTTDLREELVQVAAVAVAWIEAIDRRPPEI